MNFVIVIVLVALSGLFSGLTLGYFSLNKADLKRKADLGNKTAKRVYAIRKNGNLLLCTLLIGNVAVNATISIFLNSLASGFAAGLIATSLIVVFGEIIPQATFSRYALLVGSKLSWLVRFIIIILMPVCWPIAWALDKLLGDEITTIYSKKELIKMVEEHEDSSRSMIDKDEERIVKGALSFSEKKVKEVMTPWNVVYALSYDAQLTKKTLTEIYKVGVSRVPIYQGKRENITRLLYVKDLIDTDVVGKKAEELARHKVNFVDENETLDDLLNIFRQSRHHLCMVRSKFGKIKGLVTLEDILEEIIGKEIVDEYDIHVDLREVAKLKNKKIKKNA